MYSGENPCPSGKDFRGIQCAVETARRAVSTGSRDLERSRSWLPFGCTVLLKRKSFAAWKEFLFADSLRSLRLGGECATALSPRRREGRKENAKKTTNSRVSGHVSERCYDVRNGAGMLLARPRQCQSRCRGDLGRLGAQTADFQGFPARPRLKNEK